MLAILLYANEATKERARHYIGGGNICTVWTQWQLNIAYGNFCKS